MIAWYTLPHWRKKHQNVKINLFQCTMAKCYYIISSKCAYYLNLYWLSSIPCHEVHFFHVIPCCRPHIYRFCIGDITVKNFKKCGTLLMQKVKTWTATFWKNVSYFTRWKEICSLYHSNTDLNDSTNILRSIWIRCKKRLSKARIPGFMLQLICAHLTVTKSSFRDILVNDLSSDLY